MSRAPHYTLETVPFGVKGNYYTAIRIAKIFAHKPPTVEGLRSVLGMSNATAYRWIAAWKAANGAA